MRSFCFGLHGVSTEVVLRGGLSAEDIFPTLHALPRGTGSVRNWRIEVSPSRRPPRAGEGSPLAPSSLRIWPDTEASCVKGEDGTFSAWVDGASMHLDPARKRATLHVLPGGVDNAEKLARLLLTEILKHEGLYIVHAAAVEVGGGAVLICAPSGLGKSTLATAWACLGTARFMGEDRCVLFRRSGAVWAGGIHDGLALTPASAELLRSYGARLPEQGRLLEGKHSYGCHDVFISVCQDACPVRAVVFLTHREGAARPQSGGSVRRCDPAEATRLMIDSSFYAGSPGVMRDHFETLVDLASDVPSFLVPSRTDCRDVTSQLEGILAQHPVRARPLFSRRQRRSLVMSRRRAISATKRLCALVSTREPAREALPRRDEGRWELLKVADHHDMLPVLAARVQEATISGRSGPAPGAAGPDGGADVEAGRLAPHLANVLRVARIEAAQARRIHLSFLQNVLRAFGSEGIPWAVMHGPSVAERFYEHPEARCYDGQHVLVCPEDAGRALAVLEGLGFVSSRQACRDVRGPHTWARREGTAAGAGGTLLRDRLSQYEVRLHGADIRPGFPCRNAVLGLRSLLAGARPVRVSLPRPEGPDVAGRVSLPRPEGPDRPHLTTGRAGDIELPMVSEAAQIVLSCTMPEPGPWHRLGGLLDVALMVRGVSEEASERVVELASRCRCSGPVGLAVRRAVALFPTTAAPSLLSGLRPALGLRLLAALLCPTSASLLPWSRSSRARRRLLRLFTR